jgi:hypothetical protein
MSRCRGPAERLDYVLGVAPTSTLRRHVTALGASTTARAAKAEGKKLRRFKDFYDGAASWDRIERISFRRLRTKPEKRPIHGSPKPDIFTGYLQP